MSSRDRVGHTSREIIMLMEKHVYLKNFIGKGPQKEFYKKKIEEKDWKHVMFCLPWLEPEDYPVLLGNSLDNGNNTQNLSHNKFQSNILFEEKPLYVCSV